MADNDASTGQSSSLLWSRLIFLAIAYLASKLISLVQVLCSLFLYPGLPLRTFGPKGSWALITGASDGIGKEFSLQLAQRGFNVLLVSRTESKLTALAQEIESKSGARKTLTKTLAIDFARASDADYTRLKETAEGLDVAILVNNVGKSHDIPVPFAETNPDELTDIININCLATLRVTRLIVPAMIKRKRGLILTMASFGGLLPTPLLATYSGSKAFLQQWSTALGSELQPQGVTVELVQSYLVTSAMSKIRKPSSLVPSPRSFVKAVLERIGRAGGARGWAFTSTPYWSHALMHWALATFVGLGNGFVVRRNKAMHEGIRRKALRKREREAGKKVA